MEHTWKPKDTPTINWEGMSRDARLVVGSLDRGFFYEAVAADRHQLTLMKRNTTYVPLMGLLFESGCYQMNHVRVINARQAGKTETSTRLYEQLIHRQAAWRAIAACPTAFSLDYLPNWWRYRATLSGKSTELSLLDYVRGIYPATSPHLKDIIPHVMTGDSHRTVLRKRQVSPFNIAPPVVLTGPSNVGKSKPIEELVYGEMAQWLSSYALNITMGGKIK